MRGLRIQHTKLGAYLKQARLDAGLTLADAAMVIGLSSESHLWKCENGHVTFPAQSLRRACEVYEIKLADTVEVLIEDTADSIRNFFKKKVA